MDMAEDMTNEFGAVYTLVDEEGKESEYEHVETINMDGDTYVGLVPVDDDPTSADYGQLVILKVTLNEEGEEVLTSIENEEEFDRVADEFENVLSDEFEFVNDEAEEEEN